MKIKVLIAEAEDAIITARDFCGDEKEAVRGVLADHSIHDSDTRNKVWQSARARANNRWNGFRQQAGVRR